MLSKEIISVEEIVTIEEGGTHPKRPYPSEPPNIGLLDEVGVVKHDYYSNKVNMMNIW